MAEHIILELGKESTKAVWRLWLNRHWFPYKRNFCKRLEKYDEITKPKKEQRYARKIVNYIIKKYNDFIIFEMI
ncbi:MAG: hypothetical protein GF383_16765 [Candidatus Lokiarchaeota archaeon]|nr:hypothetical protein [Candidatus Lokiarchaeota archaeon]